MSMRDSKVSDKRATYSLSSPNILWYSMQTLPSSQDTENAVVDHFSCTISADILLMQRSVPNAQCPGLSLHISCLRACSAGNKIVRPYNPLKFLRVPLQKEPQLKVAI